MWKNKLNETIFFGIMLMPNALYAQVPILSIVFPGEEAVLTILLFILFMTSFFKIVLIKNKKGMSAKDRVQRINSRHKGSIENSKLRIKNAKKNRNIHNQVR